MQRILVTGASGFVGSHWFESSRLRDQSTPVSLQSTPVSSINFDGVDTVVHMAGIAHRMDQPAGSIYYEVNRDLTLALAQRAREAGVRQFVYLSSTKVMGEEGGYFDETSIPAPVDDYGKSKHQAEIALLALDSDAFTVSIIRPPLIYGPRVKGNVLRIMKLLTKALPLPFGGIHNARSMVFILNLLALIERIIERRASGVFIAGDRTAISTTQMVRGLSQGLPAPATLFALPKWGQQAISLALPQLGRRLFDSYVVSNEATNRTLDFTPPVESSVGLAQTGKWYAS